MTTLNHGVTAGLAAHYAHCPWEACVVIGLAGTLSDVLSLPETIHGDYTNLYQKYHSWHNNWLVWIPPDTLHIAIDKFWHKKEGGWYWWGYIVEPLVWCGEIYLFWRFR